MNSEKMMEARSFTYDDMVLILSSEDVRAEFDLIMGLMKPFFFRQGCGSYYEELSIPIKYDLNNMARNKLESLFQFVRSSILNFRSINGGNSLRIMTLN